ncbi:hypothetical protein ACFRJ3_20610 [Streptomyces sp. NPDC056696]|uniref:hypothetical protein n=1 Tax=Streptomyces sp. NPDC056696 TaxID=3345914 RepID=UPI00369D86C4
MIPRTCVTKVAMAVSALALLAGCGLPDGPTGVVVAKDNRWSSATKSRHYYLTVRTTKGERREFEAHIHDYNRCNRGSHYPTCKQ